MITCPSFQRTKAICVGITNYHSVVIAVPTEFVMIHIMNTTRIKFC